MNKGQHVTVSDCPQLNSLSQKKPKKQKLPRRKTARNRKLQVYSISKYSSFESSTEKISSTGTQLFYRCCVFQRMLPYQKKQQNRSLPPPKKTNISGRRRNSIGCHQQEKMRYLEEPSHDAIWQRDTGKKDVLVSFHFTRHKLLFICPLSQSLQLPDLKVFQLKQMVPDCRKDVEENRYEG